MNTIRKSGLSWVIVDRNRRGCTVDGRHFGAARVPVGNEWLLAELSLPITEPGRRTVWAAGPFELDELLGEIRARLAAGGVT